MIREVMFILRFVRFAEKVLLKKRMIFVRSVIGKATRCRRTIGIMQAALRFLSLNQYREEVSEEVRNLKQTMKVGTREKGKENGKVF